MIPLRLEADLENDYRSGVTLCAAAADHSLSKHTVWRWFRNFRMQGIARGKIVPRRGPRKYWRHCPPYTGPAWIGKAV